MLNNCSLVFIIRYNASILKVTLAVSKLYDEVLNNTVEL